MLCICKQLPHSKKSFIKVGGQVGTQSLRNHLIGSHPQAWRDIDQEERDEKKAKKKPELKVETTPKIGDAFSKMNKINPQGKKQSDYGRKLLELLASRLVEDNPSIHFFSSIHFLFIHFYRTQVNLGSDLWVRMSVTD